MSTQTASIWGVDLREGSPACAGSEAYCYDGAMESAHMLSRAVSDHYRCPDNFFDFVIARPLSADQGYFCFGPNAICYGRSAAGVSQVPSDSPLYDVLKEISVEEGRLRLPFDPTEIIDNLRLERYAQGQGAGSSFQSALKRLYYLMRPLTNRRMRRQVQKLRIRNWERLSFPHWPVDTTVENLCERLLLLSMEAKGIDRVPFVWFWPNGARGCLTMTHDVETQAGRDACGDLMDMDDRFGIKASFNIVPEGRYGVSSKFLQGIRDRGFDIGIQDLNHDGRLFDSREEFLRRAEIINRYATDYSARGFRAGVLYRKPEWFDALDFCFDMSIPNVAHLDPQRGGCCTVMPYFIGNILELPVTTTQDYMLFYLLSQRSIDLWTAQIELILKKNGLVSFIVHPDYVMEADSRSVYKDLLGHLRSLRENAGLWFALPTEIDRWWRARSKMRVTREGNSWRIEGDDSGQAVLAYAKKVDGNLVYELAEAPATTRSADHVSARLE